MVAAPSVCEREVGLADPIHCDAVQPARAVACGDPRPGASPSAPPPAPLPAAAGLLRSSLWHLGSPASSAAHGRYRSRPPLSPSSEGPTPPVFPAGAAVACSVQLVPMVPCVLPIEPEMETERVRQPPACPRYRHCCLASAAAAPRTEEACSAGSGDRVPRRHSVRGRPQCQAAAPADESSGCAAAVRRTDAPPGRARGTAPPARSRRTSTSGTLARTARG